MGLLRPHLFLIFPFLLCSSSPPNRVSCPLGKECMSARFCPSEEVETLDSDMVCGEPGFHRYCCSPQIREFPVETDHQPILPGPGDLPGQAKCSKDSDCPQTKLPSWLTPPDDLLSQEVEIYQCRENECRSDYDYGFAPLPFDYDLNDNITCDEEKSCQSEFVPFCAHPQGMKHSECEIKEADLVYHLTKEGSIKCKSDSDCPPAAPPSWEWNKRTMIEYGVSSITQMSIYGSVCAQNLCREKVQPFCSHEFGRNHPECLRCNLVTPLPIPRCLDYERGRLADQCCDDLFNVTLADGLSLDYQNLKHEIRQNFTKAECELSLLHQPQDQPPISPFDPSFCDPPEPGVAGGFNGHDDEFPLISAITGVSSLSTKSLLDQNSECPFSFCKRPSLARPGNLICCQLIRASWRRRRIAVCPNSCD